MDNKDNSLNLAAKICSYICPWTLSGAYEQEHATPLYFCHGVFIDRFIFKSNRLWMRLPWECHNQSQDTNCRHCVTGPELPFFHKRKGVLKIDQSVKNAVTSSAPDIVCSSKLTVFLELRSRKTVRFSEQIMSADKYPTIFSRQMKAIVYITQIIHGSRKTSRSRVMKNNFLNSRFTKDKMS